MSQGTKTRLCHTHCNFFERISRVSVTIENFQENFPVGGDADVFFIDVVVQKHCAWVLPRLFPETNPEAHSLVNTFPFFIFKKN